MDVAIGDSGIQPLVPDSALEPIDWGHLDRATMGDRKLADEVLGLFVTQAAEFVTAFHGSPGNAASLLHKLKGSARGIGAWPVAIAAEALETALATAGDPERVLTRLLAHLAATRHAIMTRLNDA